MSKEFGASEVITQYESPEIAGLTLPAAEAAGSSPTDVPDANTQHYWGTDTDGLLKGSVELDVIY